MDKQKNNSLKYFTCPFLIYLLKNVSSSYYEPDTDLDTIDTNIEEGNLKIR